MCSEFRVTDRPRWASSVRRLEVRVALNCEAAFRFPGNFLADFKREGKFISEIEFVSEGWVR